MTVIPKDDNAVLSLILDRFNNLEKRIETVFEVMGKEFASRDTRIAKLETWMIRITTIGSVIAFLWAVFGKVILTKLGF